jgi:hypothetical protein
MSYIGAGTDHDWIDGDGAADRSSAHISLQRSIVVAAIAHKEHYLCLRVGLELGEAGACQIVLNRHLGLQQFGSQVRRAAVDQVVDKRNCRRFIAGPRDENAALGVGPLCAGKGKAKIIIQSRTRRCRQPCRVEKGHTETAADGGNVRWGIALVLHRNISHDQDLHLGPRANAG